MPDVKVEILTDFNYQDRTMADPHEPSSPTSFDALMGDPRAVGLFGDSAARQMHDADEMRASRGSGKAWNGRHIPPRAKLVLAAWAAAVFVISAAVSPYLLN